MADNPQAGPAGATPAGSQSATPPTPTPAPAGAAGQPETVEGLKARLRTEFEARQRVEQAYNELRPAYTRATQENSDLKRRINSAGGSGTGDGTGITPPTPAGGSGGDSAMAGEVALIRYRQEYSDWNKVIDPTTGRTFWHEVQAIIHDPVRVQEVAHYKPDGTPDYFRSLAAAHEKVELALLRKGAVSNPNPSGGNPNPAPSRNDALLSGGGSTGGGETVDVDALSAADLLTKTGYRGYDPHDPPRALRPSSNFFGKRG